MTFSIVARDSSTGDLGIAVASKFLAVGSVVPAAAAGIGAIATQAFANVAYGPEGIGLLAAGLPAANALARLTGDDPDRASRQAGIVDALGGAATHTGEACIPWAGGRTVEGVAVQGNLLTGPDVVDSMLDTYLACTDAFPDRLVAALAAGDGAGGDRRGRQSAALLVVRDGGGYAGGNDRWIDLRVDDHISPLAELARLRVLGRLYTERPSVGDLLPIDDDMAAELRDRLAALGRAPGPPDETAALLRAAVGGVRRVGTPRPTPDTWTLEWDEALTTWMAVANLEERMAASGWIDPVVLEQLRSVSGG
jgi:uncharacterized Ntn-hydrolase superfamily protein